MRGMNIRVGLVIGKALARDAIASLCRDRGMELVFLSDSSSESLMLARQTDPDVVCAHIRLAEGNGLNMPLALRRESPRTRCVLIAEHDRADVVEKVVHSGADGFVSCESDGDALIDTIARVHAGGRHYVSSLADSVVRQYQLTPRDQPTETKLTPRQRQVLELICEGLTEREIADRLGIARNTAHVHKNNLMKSLHLHSKIELVKFAIQADMVAV